MPLFRMLSGVIALTCLAELSPAADAWIAATDQTRVKRMGEWAEVSFRRASSSHLATQRDGAALEFTFTGSGLMLTFDAHGLPFAHLGMENLGSVAVSIDNRPAAVIHPQREDRDVVIARGLEDRAHTVRLVHRGSTAGSGCRIAGFKSLGREHGELAFLVHGEASRFLTDVRAVLSRNGAIVANRLLRNWMTGQCRIAGIPAGSAYELNITASAWETLRISNIEIAIEKETELPPQYLRRTRESTAGRVEFPEWALRLSSSRVDRSQHESLCAARR